MWEDNDTHLMFSCRLSTTHFVGTLDISPTNTRTYKCVQYENMYQHLAQSGKISKSAPLRSHIHIPCPAMASDSVASLLLCSCSWRRAIHEVGHSLSWEEKRDSYWFKAFLTALAFSSSAACNSLIMKSSGLLKKRLKLRLLKKPKSFNDFFW